LVIFNHPLSQFSMYLFFYEGRFHLNVLVTSLVIQLLVPNN